MARTGPAVVRFEANALGRDFAVGDIHGAFADLRRALDAIGFDEHRDRLFSVGDLVDRGPESEAALEWLKKMQKEVSGLNAAKKKTVKKSGRLKQ